jgi:hypothetical protein
VHRRLLESRLDHRRLRVADHLPQRAVHRDADERDEVGPEAVDLPLENPPPLQVLGGLQVVDARARPRDQVGDAEAPLGQAHVPFVGDRLGHHAGGEEQFQKRFDGPAK